MTGQPIRSTLHSMDLDDLFAKAPGDPLTLLAKQDLDPLSIEELNLRIAALEAEILRARRRIEGATSHRTSADALFRR